MHPVAEVKASLLRYASFLRNRLQDADYKTFSSVDQKGRNRAYNYVWVADFYFQMYKITNDKQYAKHGYMTLRSMFKQFGHGFYAIGIPVRLGLQTLKMLICKENIKSWRMIILRLVILFEKWFELSG